MHTTEVGTANVPAFLTKLWKLVEDPAYSDLISWSSNGRSFIIRNPSRFSKELLPLYFKHNNMASFIRQLNMYGFRKLTSIENSGLRSERDEMEFYHQYFLKQQENLLEYIKRKASSSTAGSNNNISSPNHNNINSNNNVVGNGKNRNESSESKVEEVHELLASIMQRQDSQENFRVSVQNEYSSLWKEIAFLRQQNAKQQTIVQRLIQFLMSLVQNQRNVSATKRKATLMIDGIDGSSTLPAGAKRLNLEAGPSCSSSSSAHSPAAGDNSSHTNDRRSDHAIRSGILEAITSGMSTGPVIHDVTDDVIEADLEAAANSNPIVSMSNPSDGDRPEPAPLFQDIDLEMLSQVLEFTSGHVNDAVGDGEDTECSKDGTQGFRLDPDQLLALETSSPSVSQSSIEHHQPSSMNGLVSGLLPRSQSLGHSNHLHPDQQSHQANYWPSYDPVRIPVVMTNHSPDPSAVLSDPDVVEPSDFLLDPATLLDTKDDLVLLPGVSVDGVAVGDATSPGDGHASSRNSPSLSSYGLGRD